MKRIFLFLLCALFVICAVPAQATNISHKIDSVGISIALPQEMYVFTRKVRPDDKRITTLGLTYEALMASFESQDMYLEAMDTEAFNEIVVISESTSEANYYELGYDGLYNAAIAEEKALEAAGRKITSSDLFENNDIDFVKTVSVANDCQVQYTTVYNGRKIKIRLIDFDGNVTQDEDETFESIVETVTFDAPPVVEPKKEPEKNSDAQAVASPEPQGSAPSAESAADAGVDKLGRLLVIIAIAIVICTVPALLFRFVFAGGGMSAGGAGVFAFFYSAAMAVLFYYAIGRYPELNLSIYLCIIPVLWSFAIYKIVKR